MKKTITILFLFCSIISFGQISAARKLLLAQVEVNSPVFIGTRGGYTSGSNSISVISPPNTQVGDIIIAYAASTVPSAGITFPSGFSDIYSYGMTSTDPDDRMMIVKMKIATLSDIGKEYTFTVSTSGSVEIFIVVIRGRQSAPYIGQTNSQYNLSRTWDDTSVYGFYPINQKGSLMLSFCQINKAGRIQVQLHVQYIE
jgi:hypothetical protein